MLNLLVAFTPELITDIAILLVLLGFVIFGMVKGFTNIFFKAFAKIVCLILSIVLCVRFVELIDKNFSVINSVSAWVQGILPKIFGEQLLSVSLDQISANPEIVSASGMSALLVKLVLNIVGDKTGIDTTITLGEVLSPALSYYLCVFLGFIVLYVLLRFAFFLLLKAVQKLFKIKLLGLVDKLLGGVVGFLEGVIFVCIITFVLSVLPLGFAQTASSYISASKVGTFINGINLFDLMFSAFNSFDYIKGLIIGKI